MVTQDLARVKSRGKTFYRRQGIAVSGGAARGVSLYRVRFARKSAACFACGRPASFVTMSVSAE